MRDKTDMSAARIVAEIGLAVYPECQLSAIYGLTDLFRIAGHVSQVPGEPVNPVIRVSHWQEEGGDIACIYDSHPAEKHDLTYIITPPSLVMPENMRDRKSTRLHSSHVKISYADQRWEKKK